MKNDFAKRNDREDVSPFLSVFLYCPAILFLCERACVCVVVPTVGPVGAGWSPSPLPLQILGLNAEAKKKKKKNTRYTNEEGKSSKLCNCVFCIDIH